MDIVITKIRQTQILYDNISEYLSKISNAYVNSDVNDLLSHIKKNLSALESEKLTDSQSNLTDEKIFYIWHLITQIIYMVENIIYILKLNVKEDSSLLMLKTTSTELEIITNLYNNINVIFGKFMKKYQTVDIEIFKFFDGILYKNSKWTQDTVLDNVKNITKLVKKYIFSVPLYAHIMQKNLFYCTNQNVELCNNLNNILEDVKDFIFLEMSKRKILPKSLYKNNPRLTTFGLTPLHQSASLSETTKKIFNKGADKISGLSNIAKSNNVCIVIFNNVIKNPIEFSLWKLNDWKIAKDYVQSENAGVNQKIIDRFKTIEFADVPNQKWNFSSSYYGDINSDYFVIIEHLGGNKYRHISIYTDAKETIGGGKIQSKIHKSKIPQLIEFIKNEKMYVKTRISEYHRIQEKTIMKNMFLPYRFDLDEINVESQIIDSKYMRHTLSTQLLNECMNIIKTDFKKGSSIKSHRDIGTIIHNDLLVHLFSSSFIEQYYIYTFKNKKNNSTFSYAETFKTMLAQLQLLNSHFIREMHDNFVSMKIDDKIFTETPLIKNNKIKEILEQLINIVLGKLISNTHNIYQALMYKTSLLNLSIV